MEKRTKLLLAVVCAVTLSASTSCGGKNPTEPTGGTPSAPVSAGGGDDEVSALANSTMRWSLADRCPDGRGLQWRLFDQVTRSKRYPTTGVYRTPIGGNKTVSISCTTGHKICIGGTTNPASSLQFGVGINGTRRSGSILRSVACRSCANVTHRLFLFCSRRLNGEEESVLEEDLSFGGFDAEETVDDEVGEPFVE